MYVLVFFSALPGSSCTKNAQHGSLVDRASPRTDLERHAKQRWWRKDPTMAHPSNQCNGLWASMHVAPHIYVMERSCVVQPRQLGASLTSLEYNASAHARQDVSWPQALERLLLSAAATCCCCQSQQVGPAAASSSNLLLSAAAV